MLNCLYSEQYYVLPNLSLMYKLIYFRIKQKKLNRLKLIPIIECIILCGRREIALRGHKDFGSLNVDCLYYYGYIITIYM